MEFTGDQIRRIKNRNPQAIRHLVEKYQDYVYTLSLRVTRQPQAAEEVTQDVFMKVINKIDQYEGRARFTSWLYTLTYRTALNHKRRLSRADGADGQEEAHFCPPPPGEEEERNRILWRAIEALPEPCGTVITLHYLHQLSIREIAETMTLPVNTVKTHLSRGRKRLYTYLSRNYSTEEWL